MVMTMINADDRNNSTANDRDGDHDCDLQTVMRHGGNDDDADTEAADDVSLNDNNNHESYCNSAKCQKQ